ncbi:hypothetical protein MRX96_008623 [Rhipicephalus microplus]
MEMNSRLPYPPAPLRALKRAHVRAAASAALGAPKQGHEKTYAHKHERGCPRACGIAYTVRLQPKWAACHAIRESFTVSSPRATTYEWERGGGAFSKAE